MAILIEHAFAVVGVDPVLLVFEIRKAGAESLHLPLDRRLSLQMRFVDGVENLLGEIFSNRNLPHRFGELLPQFFLVDAHSRRRGMHLLAVRAVVVVIRYLVTVFQNFILWIVDYMATADGAFEPPAAENPVALFLIRISNAEGLLNPPKDFLRDEAGLIAGVLDVVPIETAIVELVRQPTVDRARVIGLYLVGRDQTLHDDAFADVGKGPHPFRIVRKHLGTKLKLALNLLNVTLIRYDDNGATSLFVTPFVLPLLMLVSEWRPSAGKVSVLGFLFGCCPYFRGKRPTVMLVVHSLIVPHQKIGVGAIPMQDLVLSDIMQHIFVPPNVFLGAFRICQVPRFPIQDVVDPMTDVAPVGPFVRGLILVAEVGVFCAFRDLDNFHENKAVLSAILFDRLDLRAFRRVSVLAL
ncbi:MAG TPA: hypothetical protein VJB59_09840 [Bdellovibrionota bacterium]|nr:hypothetical protein [Bdellovibrionota bacterium]